MNTTAAAAAAAAAAVPEPTFFGILLSTHRPKELGRGASSFFAYERAIAAISIFFFRSTVCVERKEPAVLRYFFCLLLAALAFTKKSYELIYAVEIFSYVASWILLLRRNYSGSSSTTTTTTKREVLIRILSIAAGAFGSKFLSHAIVSGKLLRLLGLITPAIVTRGLHYLFPIAEMTSAYHIMSSFGDKRVLQKMLQHLWFVTFHIQVGMGFLGIDFLRKEQSRRNQLIRLDVPDENDIDRGSRSHNGSRPSQQSSTESTSDKVPGIVRRSARFQKSAVPFILGVAVPYMVQIIFYGNINKFAFACVQDDLHRTVRLGEVFKNDNHLTAMATDSPTSPESYAASMNKVVSTAYDMFNRKLFSLPKVMLLPGVISRQPMLVVQVLPFIFLSDWLKASAVAFMTKKIESLQKEIQELTAIRSKVEAFDIKNAELLERSGRSSTQFTEKRWEELTVKVQSRVVVSDLLSRTKGFFSFIQHNFVFRVMVDCALANLIALGSITTSDIFVFSRAIEDTVDMVLMRSRGEAELARMATETEKLQNLADLFESTSKESNVLKCYVSKDHSGRLVLRNLHYSRGTASVRADHIELPPAVYALTGANGSGKSTLFRVLLSCNTNEKSIELPSSINFHTPVEPLTEEDDVFREKACLAIEDGGDDEECESDEGRSLQESSDKEPSGTKQGEATHVRPRLSIIMPSSHVVEISQNFYWPLYSKPIDWIYQEHVSETCDLVELEKRVRKVAEELHSLEFFQAKSTEKEERSDNFTSSEHISDAESAESTILHIMSELQTDKEDWFSDLSGGQKSKVELVRTVFLRDHCPAVLLVDETMAPLDPASKELVMAKLKLFCKGSIIIVIYHTDVGRGECVPSNDFFDSNLHVESQTLQIREIC